MKYGQQSEVCLPKQLLHDVQKQQQKMLFFFFLYIKIKVLLGHSKHTSGYYNCYEE